MTTAQPSLMQACVPLVLLISSAIALPLYAHADFSNKRPPHDVYVDFYVSAHSPTLVIKAFTDDWQAPLGAGNYAHLQARTSLDYRHTDSRMGIGLAMRYDYLLDFHEDSADIYWHAQHQTPLLEQGLQHLDVRAHHNHRYGVNAFVTFNPHPHVTLTPRLHFYQGVGLVDGNIMGALTTTEMRGKHFYDNVANAHTDIHYHYSRPMLKEDDHLNWRPKAPTGYGYGVDLRLQTTLGQTHIDIQALDIVGKMYWQKAPSSHYRISYDRDSLEIYDIQGQLKTEDFPQRLPWRIESLVTHRIHDQWSLAWAAAINQHSHLHQLHATHHSKLAKTPIDISAIIEPQTKSLGLALHSPHVTLKWLSDDLNTNHAKRGEFGVSWHQRW